jgi:P-type Mg2+ transporter
VNSNSRAAACGRCASPEAALGKLNSSVEGLLSRDAVERLTSYSLNTVAHETKKSALRRLGELFATPLSMLLLVLATVS